MLSLLKLPINLLPILGSYSIIYSLEKVPIHAWFWLDYTKPLKDSNDLDKIPVSM